jgi:hypothetical protein
LLACLLISVALGTVGQFLYKLRRQRAIVEAIQNHHGGVEFRHESEFHQQTPGTPVPPPGPAWLRGILGDDAFAEPVYVELCDVGATQAVYDSLALLPKVEAVHLHDGSVSAAELRHLTLISRVDPGGLAALASARSLESLSLQDPSFADADLAGVSALTSLQRIDLYDAAVTAAGLKHLAGLKQLKQLGLGACAQVVDDDLSCLLELTSLESLRLEETNAGDAALASLAKHPGITTLELGFTEISDDGLRHLAKMPQLVELDLTYTRITHAGLGHLTALPNLRRLSCYRCTQLGDDATPILAQMKQLRELNLGMTLITPAAAARLRKQLTLDEFKHQQYVKDW